MADDLDIEALLEAPFRKVGESVHWCVNRQPDPTAPYMAINTRSSPSAEGFHRNITLWIVFSSLIQKGWFTYKFIPPQSSFDLL